MVFSACKDDKREENNIDIEVVDDGSQVSEDSIHKKDLDIESIDKSITIELKQKQLIEKKDESQELEELIIDKKYLVEKEDYTINFK